MKKLKFLSFSLIASALMIGNTMNAQGMKQENTKMVGGAAMYPS
jgi:hypothetical protein